MKIYRLFLSIFMLGLLNLMNAQSQLDDYLYLNQNIVEKSKRHEAKYLDQRVTAISYHSYTLERYDSVRNFYAKPMDALVSIRTGYRQNDDGVFQNRYTDTLTYDDKNRVTRSISYVWDEDLNKYVANRLAITSFDENGNSIKISQKFDVVSNQWLNSYKLEEIYFPSTDVLKFFFYYVWNNVTSEWVLSTKETYNMDGWLLESVYYYLIVEPVEADKKVIERDENNEILTITTYELDSLNQFVKSYFEDFKRINDTLKHKFYYSWNADQMDWDLQQKTIIINNENQDILSWTVLDLVNPNEFVNNFRLTYEFDDNGNEILQTYHVWESSTNSWRPSRQYRSEYENNNLISNITSTWDDASAQLVPTIDRKYQYNSFGNRTRYDKKEWYYDIEEWVMKYQAKWYYEDYENGLSAIRKLPDFDGTVFPNPSENYLTFDINLQHNISCELSIYTATGQFLCKKQILNHHQVDIHDLPSGPYIFILKNENLNYSATGQFLKK